MATLSVRAQKQRIGYIEPAAINDPAMLEELDRCRREGTPRPENSAVRAHVPACFWSFANSWRGIFVNGVCDHSIKELCRVYVSRSIQKFDILAVYRIISLW